MHCIRLPILALFAVLSEIRTVESSAPSLELLPIKLKEIKAGDSVVFPCQTTFSKLSDQILLILLYKDKTKYPIISFDRRSVDRSKHKLWSQKRYVDRIFVEENKKRVSVILRDVGASDQSVYRCSVVYKNLPTKITKFQIKIIEPVESIFITAAVGDEIVKFDANEEVGPLELGVNLTLSCYVTGGNPLPNAIWWNELRLIDNMTEGQFNNSIVNILKLPPLVKEDNFKRFTCRAVNSDTIQPLSASVILELKLPPSCVKITMDAPFTQPSRGPKIASIPEKQSIQLYCQVLETNLVVDIVWKKNSEVLENKQLQKYSSLEKGANFQSSSIVLTPDYLDNGSVVRCLAFNTKYPEKDTEDSLILNVLFAPKVRIQLRGTSTTDVEPGEDLYLECQVASNPPVSTFNWRFNGNPIVPNTSSGVLLTASRDSLIIHDVSDAWSGQFYCSAENEEGIGQSNLLDIKVITPRVPKCTNQNQVVTAAMNTSIDLHCDVDAHPPATSFKWSSLDSTEHVQSSLALKRTSKAKLKLDIRSPSDFQTLFCRAQNLIGEMKEPCIFTVAPKGRQRAFARGCSPSFNVSTEVLQINCEELSMERKPKAKIFHLSVSQLADDGQLSLVLKMESLSPLFLIRKVLLSEHLYIFKITRWDTSLDTFVPVYLTYRIPIDALAKSRDFASIEISSSPTQLLAIILGILFTLLASLVFVCCIKRKKRSKYQHDDSHEGREDTYIDHIQECNPLMREEKVKNEDLNNFQGFMSSGRLIIGVRGETKHQISNLDNLIGLASNCEPRQRLMTITDKSDFAQNEAFQNSSTRHEIDNFENSPNSQIPSFEFQRNSNSLNSLSTDNSFASDANVSPALGDSALTVVLNPLYEP